MSIQTIIFDLGGVLIDWNPDYVYRHLIPDSDRRKYFYDHICTHDWNIEQDAGRPIQLATEQLKAEWPDWHPEIDAFYGRWVEMLGGPIPETVELFRALKEAQSHRLLALTNWSAETFPVALGRYDFLHWFEGIVVSGEEKTRKPFADIYQILMDRYEVPAETAVFIDDNLGNIQAAKSLGMHGIHFKGADQLKTALEALGVSL